MTLSGESSVETIIGARITVAAAHWIALLHAQGHPDRAAQVANDLTAANRALHLT
ncbi:MAG: hypothetical protein R2710_05935 [Acidimicrobiales bacterium]